MEIISLLPEHWQSVKTIYERGLATGNASFQTSAPSWEEWDAAHLKHSRIVAIQNNEVAGWAALTPVSGRCVYAGVAEVSVYVDPAGAVARSLGKQLLEALIMESEKNGLWTLQAGIFHENMASLHIHQKTGFRQVGIRERIGQMNGIWRDTVLLERRKQNSRRMNDPIEQIWAMFGKQLSELDYLKILHIGKYICKNVLHHSRLPYRVIVWSILRPVDKATTSPSYHRSRGLFGLRKGRRSEKRRVMVCNTWNGSSLNFYNHGNTSLEIQCS